MRKVIWSVILISVLFIGAKFPSPRGLVNDFANVLSPSVSSNLESKLSAIAAKTDIAIAVATVPTLGDMPIDDYANRLYESWGIGRKGEDKGVLILVAPNERKVRIEVGYGLEGAINDAYAGRIIREEMLPYFRAGDMQLGIVSGVGAVWKRVAESENIDAESVGFVVKAPQPKRKSKVAGFIITLLMIFLVIRHPWLIFFLPIGGGFGGGRGFGGGIRGGGFGGFGGGLSGGGGASGSW